MNASAYRSLLDAILARLGDLVRAVLSEGIPITDRERADAALMLLRSMQLARSETQAVASGYLQGLGVASDAAAEQYGLGAILDVFERVANDVGANEHNHTAPDITMKATRRVARALARHAEQPARDLVAVTAESIEGGAWQRVLTGARSCAFCAMLASRGPIYESHKTAEHGPGKVMRGGVEIDVYHDGCDCLVIFVPAGLKDWEGRAQWKRLQHMWHQADNAEDDDRPTRNVFRSFWESEVAKGNGSKYVADSIVEQASTAVAKVA